MKKQQTHSTINIDEIPTPLHFCLIRARMHPESMCVNAYLDLQSYTNKRDDF
ncbi:MAG: hypothetical protein NWF03_01910 [Candidatus Bathyarchaeota archaeon]|nr:hypothetical protein [Candidatus Bathyarchaeota archaeon]